MKEEKRQYRQIEQYIKNPDFLNRQQEAIDYVISQVEIMNRELSGRFRRDVVDSVVFRTKSAESIKKKLVRKGLPVDIKSIEEELNDLTGIRITCAFSDDVYRIAERLESNHHFNVIRIKDYIKSPKACGYQSLHMIMDVPVDGINVRTEIQLRTVAMNFWAKLDHQLAYKIAENEEMEKIQRELKFYAEEIARIDSKMLRVRKKIEKLQDKKVSDK